MSNLSSRMQPAPPNGAKSFRRPTSGPPPGDRMPIILGGNEKLMAEAVVSAVTHGLAVMFGPTRDGGALGVHAWYGENHWKDYCSSPDELEEVLTGLRDFRPAQPGPAPISPLKARISRS